MKRFAALVVLLSAMSGAGAQMRTIPLDAERGFIRHVEGMSVSIDGRPMQLAPGATIRGPNNLIIVPTALPAEGALAEYLMDGNGQIARAWLLTPDEATRQQELREARKH